MLRGMSRRVQAFEQPRGSHGPRPHANAGPAIDDIFAHDGTTGSTNPSSWRIFVACQADNLAPDIPLDEARTEVSRVFRCTREARRRELSGGGDTAPRQASLRHIGSEPTCAGDHFSDRVPRRQSGRHDHVRRRQTLLGALVIDEPNRIVWVRSFVMASRWATQMSGFAAGGRPGYDREVLPSRCDPTVPR